MSVRRLISIAFLLFLAGCASTPRLDPGVRGQFTAAKISSPVSVPTSMYYLGPGSGVGMMFGAIGGAITAAANLSPGEQLRQFAINNGVHIDEIVKDEAAKAFQQSGKLNLTDTDGPNVATLRISVPMYGFSIPNGFSSELGPDRQHQM